MPIPVPPLLLHAQPRLEGGAEVMYRAFPDRTTQQNRWTERAAILRRTKGCVCKSAHQQLKIPGDFIVLLIFEMKSVSVFQ